MGYFSGTKKSCISVFYIRTKFQSSPYNNKHFRILGGTVPLNRIRIAAAASFLQLYLRTLFFHILSWTNNNNLLYINLWAGVVMNCSLVLFLLAPSPVRDYWRAKSRCIRIYNILVIDLLRVVSASLFSIPICNQGWNLRKPKTKMVINENWISSMEHHIRINTLFHY